MKKSILIIGLVFIMLFTLAKAEYVPFKVKLNVFERIVILSLLPTETNYTNWKIINDIKNELSLTEQEVVACEIQVLEDGSGMTGKWDAVPEKEITFGEVTEKIVVDALKKLDAEGKLLVEHISLYEKFVVRDNTQ